MIPFTQSIIHPEIRQKAIVRFREKGIVLPTFAEMRNPEIIPPVIKNRLRNIGLWDLHPLNLFRISWKNEPLATGGLYGNVNYLEIPSAITGVKARIILLTGKYFPTGAHKVGAAYGCLAPRILTGEFDPTTQKAVWPSTGNYCRGGAFDSHLMGVTAVAILPEEMSRERFEWLHQIGSEVIATPGCESNVKEIYDKCDEIRHTRADCVIFNQFDEFGNPTWHYNVTAPAIQEVFSQVSTPHSRLSAYVSATGSAGTIGAGDRLKLLHPGLKIVASEALQCPTLLNNGFGGHRIEGIGDKHVPWVHNVRNTDVVTAIDDEHCMRVFRLFNEKAGYEALASMGVQANVLSKLNLLGISGVSNLLSAIKTAKYFEMDEDDILFSLATDSAEMYGSRLQGLQEEKGPYTSRQADMDLDSCLMGQTVDHTKELSYTDRKAIHNLKYFTWVEQQGKSIEDLNQLWYNRGIWNQLLTQADTWDEMIRAFNEETGVLRSL